MAKKEAQAKKTSASSKPVKPVEPATQSDGKDRSLRLLARFQRFFWDIGGVLCLALALMTLLALLHIYSRLSISLN